MTTNNLIEISIMVILFCLMAFLIKSLNYVIISVKNETAQVTVDPIFKNISPKQHVLKINKKTFYFVKNKAVSSTKIIQNIIKNIGGT